MAGEGIGAREGGSYGGSGLGAVLKLLGPGVGGRGGVLGLAGRGFHISGSFLSFHGSSGPAAERREAWEQELLGPFGSLESQDGGDWKRARHLGRGLGLCSLVKAASVMGGVARVVARNRGRTESKM